MKLLDHQNIIKLYDVKLTSKRLYLITEYCNLGNLEEFVEKNNFNEE
jgi:serine/threonine protein kinase